MIDLPDLKALDIGAWPLRPYNCPENEAVAGCCLRARNAARRLSSHAHLGVVSVGSCHRFSDGAVCPSVRSLRCVVRQSS